MNLHEQVTRTKIIPPRRRDDLLSRQRLLDLLFNLVDYKLIVVAAPAGYGKTSLLVDLSYHIELPICWYALDPLDKDPRRFIAHLIASINHRFPTFGQRSMTALQGTTQANLDLDQMVTTIVNELYTHIREHFVMVLDDFHLVDDSEEIDYFVNQFIQQVDENCHLIIASRTLITLPDLPLMVGRSLVTGLSFDELAFRADEIRALVLQNYHITLPQSIAEELAHESEGWITGLLLSAETMWDGMTDRLRAARVSGVELYDYLAQQVLDQQPSLIRDFLLRTSLMEEFDADLCQAVLGNEEDWHSIIETVIRHNLFVLPVGDEGMWLRYHHLFRDFLQARLSQEQPDEETRILQRLATAYYERGEWEKTYSLYQRLGDVTATVNLIEQIGSSLARTGRLKTLAAWLDALPPEMLYSRPTLTLLRGTALAYMGEVEEGLSLLNRAEIAFREIEDHPNLAHTLVTRAGVHRLLGNYTLSLADADEALAITAEDKNLRDARAEALRARGLCLIRMGQLNEAVEWLAQSLDTYLALDDGQRVAMLLMELGMALTSNGHYEQALLHYTKALDHWRKTDNITQQANLLNNLGVLHHLRGDYDQAALLLEEALACAEQSGYARAEAFALSGVGDLYTSLDALQSAHIAYQKAREVAQRVDDRFLLLYLDLAEAALARCKGELTQAQVLLESASQQAKLTGSGFEHGLYQLEMGRLALAKEDTLEAISHFEGAARHFDDGGQRAEGARAHLFLAFAYHQAGDQAAAGDHLKQVFHLVPDPENQHLLVIAGRETKSVLAAFQQQKATNHQSSHLFKRIVQFEHSIPLIRRRLRQYASAIPFAPPQLHIQVLGKTEVTLDGKPVTNTEWQTQSARDLFLFLLDHPEGVAKEVVESTLWPGDPPERGKLKFKNSIYRLRHALGRDVVLYDGESYHFNRKLDYEYDVEVFLGKLTQAQKTHEPSKQMTAYRTTAQHYKGPYLPDVEGEWIWLRREQLRQAYFETTLTLAKLHLEANEYDTALEYCEHALAEDPCLEEAHRLAMQAHAALGNRAAVARQFDRCRKALHQEVKASPSSQTESLYEMLMR